MEKAPYTPNPKNVIRFFTAIQSLGIPPKVSQSYLPTIGFRSANDRYLPGVLKFLGFTDKAGVPTEQWKAYKDKNKARQVMTSAIRTAYADLFNTYPDADKRDNTAIENYFASALGVSTQLAKLMEQTFRNLCGLADFEAAAVTEPSTIPTTPSRGKVSEVTPSVKPVTININIQLSLPATEDASIYDKLFEALKKHLFS